MPGRRFLLIFLSFCFLLLSCSAQPTRAERIKQLNQFNATNDFMGLFLKFVKEQKLAETLIDYEDMLIQKKYLDGYSDKALHKYFEKLIKEKDDDRCIDKLLSERIKYAIFNFDYSRYKEDVEQKELQRSKEYIFIEYLKSGGAMWRESLEYALKDNKLTPDKKYFYLLLTAPYRNCN